MNYDNETRARTSNHREVILDLLRSRGVRGVSNRELSDISLCYGKRISELRERGVVIDNTHKGGGEYIYTLVKEPTTEVVRPKAIDALLQGVKDIGGQVNPEELEFLLSELGLQVRWKAGTYKEVSA